MNNDNASPVKLVRSNRHFKINSFSCLICGKQGRKDELRNPGDQGVTSFISALLIRKVCNGFIIDEFKDCIDFETQTWKSDRSQLRWHPNCYASYVSSQNQGNRNITLEYNQPSTRSKKELADLGHNCFFCGFKKRNKDSKLCLIQYEHVLKQLEEQCNLKNDHDLRRKIGGDFSNLPALDAKYHASCYKAYMRPIPKDNSEAETCHDAAFALLAVYMDPLLSSGRALTIRALLDKYKHFLADQHYEYFDSYTAHKLKSRILKNFILIPFH